MSLQGLFDRMLVAFMLRNNHDISLRPNFHFAEIQIRSDQTLGHREGFTGRSGIVDSDGKMNRVSQFCQNLSDASVSYNH